MEVTFILSLISLLWGIGTGWTYSGTRELLLQEMVKIPFRTKVNIAIMSVFWPLVTIFALLNPED